MIAAVFDLDRTLLPGTTAERLLLRQLIRERIVGVRAALRTVRFAFSAGLADAAVRIRAERPYLVGLHEATLRLHGHRCMRTSILPGLACRGLERLEQHRRAGHHIVLLSGSLPYVVEPLGSELRIDKIICSYLEVCRLRITGRMCGLHPYGAAKARLIGEYASCAGLDLSGSYCYADHHSDVELLEMFGYPVCVNPSTELHRIAAKCGWRIEAFT